MFYTFIFLLHLLNFPLVQGSPLGCLPVLLPHTNIFSFVSNPEYCLQLNHQQAKHNSCMYNILYHKIGVSSSLYINKTFTGLT
jgi:hypothetical protein